MNYMEVIRQVNDILRANCDSPIAEMRKMGHALIEIADALEGKSVAEACAIIEAVRQIETVRSDER